MCETYQFWRGKGRTGGEHVVLPDRRVPPSPMEPEDPMLDPVIALTFILATRSAGGRSAGPAGA